MSRERLRHQVARRERGFGARTDAQLREDARHVTSYGDPRLRSDIGFGAELLPALEHPFSLSAAYYYYPEVHGTYATLSGASARLRYKLQTFDLRAHVTLPRSPLFLEIGFYGDRYLRKENAPSDATHRAFDLGFGVRV